MTRNTHPADRAVRIVLAAGFVWWSFYTPLWAAVILWISAAILAVTAFFGVCLIYKIFGVTTCKECGAKA